MIERELQDLIKSKFGSGRAIIIVGARQVGKTTLIKHILEGSDYLFLDADHATVPFPA